MFFKLTYIVGAFPEESKPPPPARFAPDITTDTLKNNDARAKIWCTTAFTAMSKHSGPNLLEKSLSFIIYQTGIPVTLWIKLYSQKS